jgi:4-diphosphocytidyl-2-C-methyl-D-erythritol kinase
LPQSISRQARAKINLALHVMGRRDDGYHTLDTLAVFADVGDRLWFAPAERLELTVDGPFADLAPVGDGNLVLRAAALLKTRTGFTGGAAIRLLKELPAGAGFGGGSADAAAALQGLNELWGVELGEKALAGLGAELGADVPMCLAGRALRARGIGERIERLAGWPELPLLLVWPEKPVSTAEAFGALARRDNPPMPEPPALSCPQEAAAWLAACRNDLEEPALRLTPDIGEALAALRQSEGCLLARMSGSGSGCFGLYATRAGAEAAEAALRRPGWWVRAAMAG